MSWQNNDFPQVLLLGNGLNRAYDGENWGNLITELYCNPKVNMKSLANLPYPLQAVLATGDTMETSIQENQALFYGAEDVQLVSEQIRQLLGIGFDDILTTNYSYEIERVANPNVKRDGEYCKKMSRHTSAVSRVERIYLLHTYNEVSFNGKTNRVWHIHGEARKPSSIILGHYYYGKLLGEFQKELDKRKNKHYWREQAQETPIMSSWIDSFILGDVYVLGFGYDFSEMDLWWLLNRKKREKADHGKLYFYTPTEGKEQVAALINAYGGEVRNLDYWNEEPNYKEFYKAAIFDIQNQVEAKRKG